MFWRYVLFRVKVVGESMRPGLVPGRFYWASSLRRPRAGDVVVFRNPADPSQIYVKKVDAVTDGVYSVSGTAPFASSHEVPAAFLIGTLLLRRRR